MVLPNSNKRLFNVDNVDSGTTFQLMSDNKTGHEEQVLTTSSTPSNSVLFILGLIFTFGLFVFLIVIVVAVCIWARQAHGYIFGGEPDYRNSTSVARNDECQLTCHNNHENKLFAKRLQKDLIRNTPKEDTVEHSTLVTLPSPPVKTVVLSAQVSCTDSREGTLNAEPYHIIDECDVPESIQAAQPQNYGTLSRTHLLSSVDEDGYHFDNLGFECNQDTSADFFPSFDQTESLDTSVLDSSTQADLNKLEKELAESLAESLSTPLSPGFETESFNQKNSQKRQLSKQDSFQGLPPFKSFDKYLTLVSLDSTISLEETKKQWESIEEEDKENDDIDSVEEKQLQK